MACGSRSPACSAIVQQLRVGNSANNPRRNIPARRRVATRGNRAVIPASSLSIAASRVLPATLHIRPPHDHLKSAQPRRITWWPTHVRHRHAARSRLTAGVLDGVWTGKEIVYGITSLPANLAGPAQLNHYERRHWVVE